MSEFDIIQEQDRFFIKSFIIDETLNLNYWATTDAAIDNDLSTFIGKPFVITPDAGHPDAADGNQLMIEQEKFRVGTIIEVGRDASNGKAWALTEITDAAARKQIQDGEIRFVSPSITFNTATDMISVAGQDIVTRFNAAHLAGVKEPAYGMQKAQIKGSCAGSPGTCIPQLNAVQASVEKSKCGKILTINEGTISRVVKNASECMESCLLDKSEQGLIIDDEAIARCYSDCKNNSNKDQDSPKSDKVEVVVNVNEGEVEPTQVCTECDGGDCKCSSNKAKSEDNVMTDENINKDEKKSSEEELEEKRKEEAKKAEFEKKEDEKKADEDKKSPLDAEEEEDRKEKDARIKALEAELHAEKQSFIDQILAAKKAGGHILEAEEKSEATKLGLETLVSLKSLAAAYTEKAEAGLPKGKPYHVLNYTQASTTGTGEDFLKALGAKSD